MRLSVITINYNGSEKTIRLLKSLAKQTDKDFQTIVIDNASDEADFNNLNNITKGTFAKVPFVIRNDKNLGFSGGGNVGIKKALENGTNPVKSPLGNNGASWVLLLNNDTWVKPSFVASLKAKLTALGGSRDESRPNGRSQSVGIVGIPLNEGDHTAYCGKIEWLKPTLKHVYSQLSSLPAYKLLDFYAIGGGMAIHRDVFQKIGFMDEKYFLYFEDADFSIKARKAGIKISIAQDFMIYHEVSSTTKKLGAPLLLRYHYRNALYFNWKNGPWYIKLLVWPWGWWVIIKQVLKIMTYHNRSQSWAILRGVLDFYKNKMGKIQ